MLIVAELAWRWAFAVGAIGILLSYSSTLRDAISLSAADQNALLSGNIVAMVSVGLNVMAGALPYLIRVVVGATPKIALVWWVCATVGRGPILREMMRFTSRPPGSSGRKLWTGMAAVHFVRLILLLLVLIGYLGGARLSSAGMGDPNDPNILLMFFLFLGAFAVGVTAWSLANFAASNGALFVAAGDTGGLDAIALGLQFSLVKRKQLWGVAAMNALLRTVAAGVITILAILLIPVGKFIPMAVMIALLVLLTVIYCVISDILLLARTLSYMVIAFGEPDGEGGEKGHESALYRAPSDLRK